MQMTEREIQSELIEILKDITQDWEIDEIEILPTTKIVEDLGFVSIDIIQLVVAIEEHFQQKLGFNELLMKNGRYIDDLGVEEIAKFVEKKVK
ncbi:MAG: acyl carrier protein [Hormoscilla sp.]